jgi:hypothetical protein
MPVLREGGPVAGFVFHAAHEWLGWSTERSASAANLVSGLTNLAGAKIQQKYSLRNAGQSASPPDEMTPPPEHVAPAPGRDPVPAPGRSSGSTTGAGVDPWAGAVARPIDATPGAASTGSETRTSTALVRVGPQALTLVPRTTTAGPATTAGQPDVRAGAVAARPQLGSQVILPSVAPAPGESPAYQMPLGAEGAGGVRLMNRGLQPPDLANSGFRGSMIADDPVHLDLWVRAEASLVHSPRANVYKTWLAAVQDGSVTSWSSKQLQRVYGAVWDEYKELARAQGIDVATIHHWNYNKDLYPYQVVDPRNLLPVYGQSEMRGGWHPYHQGGLHRLMSGGHPTNDPIDPVHELKLENYNVPRLDPDYPGAPFGWHPPMLPPADLPFGWDLLHPPEWVWPEGTPPSRTPR